MRLIERGDVAQLDGGDPWIPRIERAGAGSLERKCGENLLALMPADEKKRNSDEPAPGDLDGGERRTPEHLAHVLDQQLRSAHGSIAVSVRQGTCLHLTTRLTALPGTTITLTTVL